MTISDTSPKPELSVTIHYDREHEVFMTEEDLTAAWKFCGNNFPRFIELLRFIAQFGDKP